MVCHFKASLKDFTSTSLKKKYCLLHVKPFTKIIYIHSIYMYIKSIFKIVYKRKKPQTKKKSIKVKSIKEQPFLTKICIYV